LAPLITTILSLSDLGGVSTSLGLELSLWPLSVDRMQALRIKAIAISPNIINMVFIKITANLLIPMTPSGISVQIYADMPLLRRRYLSCS
jgi:hypothetical protein